MTEQTTLTAQELDVTETERTGEELSANDVDGVNMATAELDAQIEEDQQAFVDPDVKMTPATLVDGDAAAALIQAPDETASDETALDAVEAKPPHKLTQAGLRLGTRAGLSR